MVVDTDGPGEQVEFDLVVVGVAHPFSGHSSCGEGRVVGFHSFAALPLFGNGIAVIIVAVIVAVATFVGGWFANSIEIVPFEFVIQKRTAATGVRSIDWKNAFFLRERRGEKKSASILQGDIRGRLHLGF